MNKVIIFTALLLVISPVYAITTNEIVNLAAQSQWDWQTFDPLPHIKTAVVKPNETSGKDVYKFSQEIEKDMLFEGYGNKQKPKVVLIKYEKYINIDDLKDYEIAMQAAKNSLPKLDIDPSYLKPIASNCNLKDLKFSYAHPQYTISAGGRLDSQQIYQVNIPNKPPLYLAYSLGTSFVASSIMVESAVSKVMISKNKQDLAWLLSKQGWHFDKNGKKYTCKIN